MLPIRGEANVEQLQLTKVWQAHGVSNFVARDKDKTVGVGQVRLAASPSGLVADSEPINIYFEVFRGSSCAREILNKLLEQVRVAGLTEAIVSLPLSNSTAVYDLIVANAGQYLGRGGGRLRFKLMLENARACSTAA